MQILPLECLERFKEVALGYNPDGTLAYHYGPALVISHFKKDCEKHYGTHAVRHTFATRLLSKTSSHQKIKAVAELLGDDYKVVVKTHLHTDEDGKHNLVDMLND